jgi:hypothetical protein
MLGAFYALGQILSGLVTSFELCVTRDRLRTGESD